MFFPLSPQQVSGGLAKFPSAPPPPAGKTSKMAGRRLLNASSRPRCPVLPSCPCPVPSSTPSLAAFPPQPAGSGRAPGAGWLWKRLHGRQERLLVLQPSCLLDRNFKPDVFSHRAEICFCLSARPIGNTAAVARRAGAAGACFLFFFLFFFFFFPVIPAEEQEFVRVQVAFSRELWRNALNVWLGCESSRKVVFFFNSFSVPERVR